MSLVILLLELLRRYAIHLVVLVAGAGTKRVADRRCLPWILARRMMWLRAINWAKKRADRIAEIGIVLQEARSVRAVQRSAPPAVSVTDLMAIMAQMQKEMAMLREEREKRP